MKYYFSESTNAFYPDSLRADYEKAGTWPADAVEIEDLAVVAEFSGQPPEGKRRVCLGGVLQWVDVRRSADDLAMLARSKRNALLSATDWMATRAWETGTPLDPRVVAYRAALRSLPEQTGFPTTITWPSLT